MLSAIAALVLGVLVAAPSAQAQTKKISYAIAELSPEATYESTSVSVRDVNNCGHVVGYSWGGTGATRLHLGTRRPR